MSSDNTENLGSGPDLTYQAHLNKKELFLPKCLVCNEFHFYPRVVCPHCGSFDLEWQALSGRGEVYSTTVIRRKPERGGNYNVCLVTLKEGPRMMSRIDGIPAEDVKIGDKVTASIINNDGECHVIFSPSQEA
ncbi:MAG: DNA-binding protein [Cycloclasticus sp. symbiont of Poecilosclerida sp. M]|nr:MAG: DNA-binding protein [Cycloclasticus sp. symbiont of Poecilosclerida sp. M]